MKPHPLNPLGMIAESGDCVAGTYNPTLNEQKGDFIVFAQYEQGDVSLKLAKPIQPGKRIKFSVIIEEVT